MNELKLLLLEDSPADAELLEFRLRKEGMNFSSLRVDSESAFKQALADFKPDIVLADYNLPSYTGHAALGHVQQAYPDIPVVMVTGAIGEEMAVELLRSGAKDYILKDRMTRLPAAIRRVLEEREQIRARRESEKKLREAENKFRTLFEASNDGIFLLGETGFVDCNRRGASMYGLTREDIVGHSLAEFCPEKQPDGRLSRDVANEKIQAAMQGKSQAFEWSFLCAGNALFDADINLNRVEFGGSVYLQAVVRDITERKKVEQALRESESRFRNLVETTSDWIWEVDENFVYTYASPRIKNILGFEPAEVLGKTPFDLMSPDEAKRVAGLFAKLVAAQLPLANLENTNLHRDGYVVVLETSGVPVVGADGKFRGYRGIDRDITQRKRVENALVESECRLRQLADFDELTKLPNRRLLFDRIGQAMLASKRSGRYGALMFLDLDNFKPLNDAYGHDVGDLLLIEVARRINSCVREMDTVARFGGDEFVVMLSELEVDKEQSRTQAGVIAEKIRAVLAEPYELTFSVGVDAKKRLRTAAHRVSVLCCLSITKPVPGIFSSGPTGRCIRRKRTGAIRCISLIRNAAETGIRGKLNEIECG
jgi:diguanylate cyclase (GGDEF)-like protein/PAS domain S-box-containing protein